MQIQVADWGNLWHPCLGAQPDQPPHIALCAMWGYPRWTASRSPERLFTGKSNPSRIALSDTVVGILQQEGTFTLSWADWLLTRLSDLLFQKKTCTVL